MSGAPVTVQLLSNDKSCAVPFIVIVLVVGTFSASSSSNADWVLVAAIFPAGTTVTDDAGIEPVAAVVLVTAAFLRSWIALNAENLLPALYHVLCSYIILYNGLISQSPHKIGYVFCISTQLMADALVALVNCQGYIITLIASHGLGFCVA